MRGQPSQAHRGIPVQFIIGTNSPGSGKHSADL